MVCVATTPDETYPGPTVVTLAIVTVEFPAFVRVAVSVLLLPTLTFPKGILVVLELRTKVAATPVPVSGIVNGDVAPLFVNETEPLTGPGPVGANIAVNVVLPPAAMFAGRVSPLMLYPFPDAEAAVIVNVPVPVFLIWTVCEFGNPTVTFPKATDEGVAVMAGCVPVPVIPIVMGEPGALLVIEMVPAGLPVTRGANFAEIVELPPAAIEIGSVNPLTE
jgi:hypothetical protein